MAYDPVLTCPICLRQSGGEGDRTPLVAHDGGLSCARGHQFDRAKQGYVSLLVGRHVHQGDRAAMIQARGRVHRSGFLSPIQAWLDAHTQGRILDLGGGPGTYLGTNLRTIAQNAKGTIDHPLHGHVLIDASTPALKVAAKINGIQVLGADLLAPLPLADDQFDTVWSVFAPRPWEEIHRVIRPGGRLLCVLPTSEHLTPLREVIPGMLTIAADKTEQVISQAVGMGFILESQTTITQTVVIDPQTQADLVAMGPSAFHLSEDEITARIGQTPRAVILACHGLVFTTAPRS